MSFFPEKNEFLDIGMKPTSTCSQDVLIIPVDVFCKMWKLFELVQTSECNFFPLVLQCTEAQKLFNIANELLHTEEAYVKRLHLLDQVQYCLFVIQTNADAVTGHWKMIKDWEENICCCVVISMTPF